MFRSVLFAGKRVFDSIKVGVTHLLTGKYDAAQFSDDDDRHWTNADDKPAVLAHTPEVRKRLRSKAQYEADNNCYCSGLVSTRATDVIGYTLPKLRIIDDDKELKTFIETEWDKWTKNENVNLSHKLKLLDETKQIQGEGFLSISLDSEVERQTGYNLNVNVLDAGRISDPYGYNQQIFFEDRRDGDKISRLKLYNDDGVVINLETGRPIRYKIIPPDYYLNLIESNPLEIDAKYILQWFNPRKPGQFRGVSELTPAIKLFGQLRRYDLATLTAAETAAMLAGIMKTTAPVGEPGVIKPFTKIELERGTLVSMPDGWDATQFRPEQPIQAYEMFVNLILRQIGRALDVPFGIVAGDSSKYNYSSAQLDYRGYEERGKFDQSQLVIRIKNPLYREFLVELAIKHPNVRQRIMTKSIYHNWTFARRPSSDPQKDAEAEAKRLDYNTTNLSEIYAARGLDWEEELEQRQKELEKIKSLSITVPSNNGTIPHSNGVPI